MILVLITSVAAWRASRSPGHRQLSPKIATPTEMTQGEPRKELKRRGLIVCGGMKDLRLRFLENDAFRVIGGNLATLADEYL